MEKFDGLPVQNRGNIGRVDVPLDRHAGDPLALDEDEVSDVIAFLGTLTDGYLTR